MLKIKITFWSQKGPKEVLIPVTEKLKFSWSNFNDECRTVYTDSGTICMEKHVISIEITSFQDTEEFCTGCGHSMTNRIPGNGVCCVPAQ